MTPLMLNVLILTYHDTTLRAFSKQETRLNRQIWTDYVWRMVERKGDIKRYTLERTRAWLGWLANLHANA